MISKLTIFLERYFMTLFMRYFKHVMTLISLMYIEEPMIGYTASVHSPEISPQGVLIAQKNGTTLYFEKKIRNIHIYNIYKPNTSSGSSYKYDDVAAELIEKEYRNGYPIIPTMTEEWAAAVEWGIVDKMAQLLATGLDPNAVNEYGCSALQYLAGVGHLQGVQLLLNCPKIDVNLVDALGNTALRSAAYSGSLEITQLLLNRPEIDVNFGKIFIYFQHGGPSDSLFGLHTLARSSQSAFNTAMDENNTEIAHMIMRHSSFEVNGPLSDIDITDQKVKDLLWPPLFEACYYNAISVVEELLLNPLIHVNIIVYGRSLLKIVCEKGFEEIAALLLAHPQLDTSFVYNQHKNQTQLEEALEAALIGGFFKISEIILNHPVFNKSQNTLSLEGQADLVHTQAHRVTSLKERWEDGYIPQHTLLALFKTWSSSIPLSEELVQMNPNHKFDINDYNSEFMRKARTPITHPQENMVDSAVLLSILSLPVFASRDLSEKMIAFKSLISHSLIQNQALPSSLNQALESALDWGYAQILEVLFALPQLAQFIYAPSDQAFLMGVFKKAVAKNYDELINAVIHHPCFNVNINPCKDRNINQDTLGLYGLVSPLQIACSYGSTITVEKLLKHPEIDVNLEVQQNTPLTFACSHWGDNTQVVKLLLSHPAIDIYKTLKNNYSALGVILSTIEKGNHGYWWSGKSILETSSEIMYLLLWHPLGQVKRFQEDPGYKTLKQRCSDDLAFFERFQELSKRDELHPYKVLSQYERWHDVKEFLKFHCAGYYLQRPKITGKEPLEGPIRYTSQIMNNKDLIRYISGYI